MGRKVLHTFGLLFLFVTVVACQVPAGSGTTSTGTDTTTPPETPTMPTRLIIDTYDPTTAAPFFDTDGWYSVGATHNTWAWLYKASDLLNPIDSNTDGGSTRPATPEPDTTPQVSYTGFAYIDYNPASLAAGDYYVKVTLDTSNVTYTQPYALRVLGAANTDYTTWVFTSGVPTTSVNQDSTQASTIALNGKVAMFLKGGDTNWFKITLP
jgi:hypothetical protein